MTALKAHWETIETLGDERAAPRRKLNLAVHGTTSSGVAAEVLIHNLSTSGLLIETSADLSIGEPLEVEMPEAGATSAIVVWNSDRLFGCEFMTPVGNAAISAARLRTPAERPDAAPLTDSSQHEERADHFEDDGDARSRTKLPLGARALIIVGAALLTWALTLWTIALIM